MGRCAMRRSQPWKRGRAIRTEAWWAHKMLRCRIKQYCQHKDHATKIIRGTSLIIIRYIFLVLNKGRIQYIGNNAYLKLDLGQSRRMRPVDRKSVEKGKRVSVRVDIGGSRKMKKKKKEKQ